MSTTKIALVTGGSRGLGKDMAINLELEKKDLIELMELTEGIQVNELTG